MDLSQGQGQSSSQKTTIRFKALDYTKDDGFQQVSYEYVGGEDIGWVIWRNGVKYLQLGKGYVVLKVVMCGICSTDLDRRYLPFPLPQVTGHELIAKKFSLDSHACSQKYVVQINDTFQARGDKEQDAFCLAGIPTHSPERRTLGINMLPGGFAPYVLVPRFGVFFCGFLPDSLAVLTQPFAAALQAVIASPPKQNDSVAVLGPRRLGTLLLSALKCYRNTTKTQFHITSLTRHKSLQTLSKKAGADTVINLLEVPPESPHLQNKYDIVYDTTSTESGFATAMRITRKQLHLKSTNGREMVGLKALTEVVVDQVAVFGVEEQRGWGFCWGNQNRDNKTVYVSPSLAEKYKHLAQKYQIFTGTPSEALTHLTSNPDKKKLPRFDLALAGNPQQLARCIRPIPNSQQSLIRPRGAILIDTDDDEGWKHAKQARQFFKAGKEIHSSRCGDFGRALELLKENPEVVEMLKENMVTDWFGVEDLGEAFKKARDPSSIKVVIKHDLTEKK